MIYGIVGNRYGWSKEFVFKYIKECIGNKNITRIVSGGAIGIDTFAEEYASVWNIDFFKYLPDMSEPSPDRYFNRNTLIAENCDILIAFDNKEGRSGTKNTINTALRLGKQVILVEKEVLEK